MTQNEPAEATVWLPVREGPAAVPEGPAAVREGPAAVREGPAAVPEGPGTTGDPQVDAALDKLADLAELPLNEHPAVFERIHGALAGALGTLDSTTGDSTTGDPGSTTGDPGPGAGHPGSGGPGY